MVLILAFGGIVAATFWLSVYVYGLYRLGRWLAGRYRGRPIRTLVYICSACALFSFAFLAIPLEPVIRAFLALGVWILHAQPIAGGFWGGVEMGRKEDVARWHRQAEEWLRDWEEPVPNWFKDQSE